MSEVQTRISQLRDAASQIGTGASQIDQAIHAAMTAIRSLEIGTRVVSRAAEDFQSTFDQLTPQLQKAYEDLVNFQKRLNTSADDIERAATAS